MSSPTPPPHSVWRASLRAVIVLLLLWAIVGLGLGVLFVEPLNEVRIGGFKLGFWFAQQGSILAFVVLTLVYALWMDRIERRAARPDSASRQGAAEPGQGAGEGRGER